MEGHHAGGGVDRAQLPRVGGTADAVGRVAAGAGDQLARGRVPVQHAELVALGAQEEGVRGAVLGGGRGVSVAEERLPVHVSNTNTHITHRQAQQAQRGDAAVDGDVEHALVCGG